MDEQIWKTCVIRALGCSLVVAGFAAGVARGQESAPAFTPLVTLPASKAPDLSAGQQPAPSFGKSILDEGLDADAADEVAAEPRGGGQYARPLFGDVVLEDQVPTFPYHFTFIPRFMVGPVSGYTQISKDGAPGSTDHHRPRLSELGIGDALIPDLELDVARGPHEVYAGIQIIRLEGTESVRQTLTTAGHTFAKGVRLRSNENMDWYRFGYRYAIPLFPSDEGVPRLTITPAAEFLWWTYEYRVIQHRGNDPTTGAAQPPIEAKQSFDKYNGRLGANIEWRPFGGPFSIDANAMVTPPISGTIFLATEELMGHYRLLDNGRYGMDISLGVVFEQMDYDNNKSVPDHVKVDFGPLLVIGANIKF
ncbi:MAG TPA: hypothetical protein VH370_07265 [Humisphaera sp.]|jgi:hypothetical protein|nr:hypothetical protein [Humisphaera sp.]